MITRRSALQTFLATSALPLFGSENSGFSIGACDWSIGHKQHIDAFKTAKQIGLEGIQVSFSTPGSDFDLRDSQVRQQYYRKVDDSGIRIASLGMGVLNQMPLATHPESISWVGDAIDTIAALKRECPDLAPSVCLLAFFGKGDINGKPKLMDSVVEKLKTVAARAEDNGVILGLESQLSADDHLKIIDGVGSKAIQVYYDSANSDRMGYNIYEEVVQLGHERICEVHCKENRALIGEGVVDFPRFRNSLEKAGYKGWLIIEGSLPQKADLVESYKANYATLDRLFRK